MSQRKKLHQPSDREKINKVTDAIAALEDENSIPIIIDDRHNAEAMELTEAEDMDGVLAWVLVLLKEIEKIGPKKCFTGRNAPLCDHEGFNDLYLFPYAWDSESLEKCVYLKFAIKRTKAEDGDSITYYHLDLHESRPK